METLTRTVLLFLASAQLAMAAPATSDAWIRYVPGKENAAGYLTLTATEADTLTAAASDCCARVELHEIVDDNGVMRMREVNDVALPKAKPVTFAPLGHHLMLIGVKETLTAEKPVTITLTYGSGASQDVAFTVKPVGAAAAPSHEHHHDHGGHH